MYYYKCNCYKGKDILLEKYEKIQELKAEMERLSTYIKCLKLHVLDTNSVVAKKKVVMFLIVVGPTNDTILRDLISL